MQTKEDLIAKIELIELKLGIDADFINFKKLKDNKEQFDLIDFISFFDFEKVKLMFK